MKRALLIVLAGAGLGAGFAAWKITAAIWGLMTAGTNLNAAAVALQAAAVSLGGSSAVDGLTDTKTKSRSWLKSLGVVAGLGGIVAALNESKNVPEDKMAPVLKGLKDYWDLRRSADDAAARRQQMERLTTPYNANTPGVSDYFRGEPRLKSPYEAATEAMERRQAFEANTGPRGNTPGLGDIFKPQVDMGDANAAATEASRIGDDIQNALNVSAKPNIDTTDLRTAFALVNGIKSGLQGIGGLVQTTSASVSRQMNRNFTDQGVTP